MNGKVFSGLIVLLCLYGNVALAIELNPTEEAIAKAIEDGRLAATTQTPGLTPNTIGRLSLVCQGYGFLQTKLWNIRASSEANEKKMRPTKREEIDQALTSPVMLITFMYCNSSPGRSDDHMVIKQQDRVIQPKRVSNSTPDFRDYLSRSTNAHEVQAFFSYEDLDPTAESTIIVIPNSGKRMEFPVSLSEFP